MKFVVVIHGKSPIGIQLLEALNKIGGASGKWTLEGMEHPVIIAQDLQWDAPAFVRMTHLRDPAMEDPQPIQLVVPANTVLAALEWKPGIPQNAEPQKPSGPLH